MFLVHTETVKGRMTIGFVGTTRDEMARAFNPLANLLASMTDPVVVNQSHAYVAEVPDDTPATMKFEYLGYGESEFASQEELTALLNQYLARDIFPCVLSMKVDGGRVTAEFESFKLLAADSSVLATSTVH